MSFIIMKERNHLKTFNTKKQVYYRGKLVRRIDLSETTANFLFAEIMFKGDDKSYIIKINNLDLDNLKEY